MSKSKNNNLGSVLTKSPNETITVHVTLNHWFGEHNVFIVKNGDAYAFTSSSIVNDGGQAIAHKRVQTRDCIELRILSPNIIEKEVIPNASKSFSFTKECGTAILRILQMYLGHTQGQSDAPGQTGLSTQKKSKSQKRDTCSIKNGRRK